jgi:hypothetical protein
MWQVWLGLALGLFVICFVFLRFRHRAERAEVVVETLRLWREFIAEYRRQHPDETYSFSVAEEACYMAVKGPRQLRSTIAKRAFFNVRDMKKYGYEEYDGADKLIGHGQILAHTTLDAARKIAGPHVIELGFPHQLRVRIVRGASENELTDFYKVSD